MFKVQKIFFIGMLALVLIFLHNFAMCEQSRLEKKLSELQEVVTN